MNVISRLWPIFAVCRLLVGVGGRNLLCEGRRSSYLSKMYLIKDHLVGMSNAPESSYESQKRYQTQCKLVIPFRGDCSWQFCVFQYPIEVALYFQRRRRGCGMFLVFLPSLPHCS